MARIADLTINLNADDRKLKRDLNRARGQWRKYSRQVGRDMQKLGSLVKRGAGIATAALGALGVVTLKNVDAMQKAARNAGLSFREYQTLSHAFELAGSSAATLTKGSQTLARQIFDLGRGLSTPVEAFEALGLSYEQLARLSPADQFRTVVDALRNVENATDRTALASVVLGKAGKELGTVFATTSEQMLAAETRLERLGGVVTVRAAANAERLNDEFALLSRVLQSQFANGMLSSIQATNNWDRSIRAAGEAANHLGAVIPRILSVVIEFRQEILIGIGALVAWRVALAGAAVLGAIRNAGKAVAALIRYMRKMNLMLAKSILKWVGLSAVIAGLAASIYAVVRAFREGISIEESFRRSWQEATEYVRDLFGDLFDDLSDRFEESFELGDIDIPPITVPIVPDITVPPVTVPEVDPPASVPTPAGRAPIHPAVEEMLTNIRDFVGRLGDTLRSSLADAIESGDWSAVGTRLVGTLRRMFAERTADRVASAIENLLGNVIERIAGPGGPLEGIFGALFGGFFGGGGGDGGGGGGSIGSLLGGSFGGPIGSIFGGLIGGLFHEGGVVPGAAGQNRLIVAQAGEVVLNRAQQQALITGMGGGGVNISLSVTGDVTSATRRAVLDMGRELAGIVQGEFRETGASFA